MTFSVTKDPEAVLDYSVDWSTWLDGDTISSSSWSVDGSGLVIDSDSNSTTAATVWLSGGAASRTYRLVNHITTAGSREDDRTITVTVVDK